jgi:hypothetical protein
MSDPAPGVRAITPESAIMMPESAIIIPEQAITMEWNR